MPPTAIKTVMLKYTLNTAFKPSVKTNIQLKISPSTVSRAASINNYIEMKVSDITRQFRFFLVKHIVFITVCFALLFFSEAVRQLIQNWFLDNGWGVVESSIVNDVLFYAAAIVIGYLSYLKLKSTIKGRVLDTSILMALYVAVISYYCFGVFRTHNIVSTHFVDGVKYVYLLYAPVLGLACWWLFRLIRICKKWCKKKEQPQSDTNHNGFVGDEPIENVDESIYPNTKEYANQLCENLLNTNNQKFAFAAGVTGDWGSGKTSFLNCMKDYLKKKGVIIVEFNPWMCDSPERIVKEFFLLLKEQLEIYSPFIGNYFDEYIALLLSSNEHFMLKSLRYVFNKRSVSTTALYEKLKSDIECIGKKIIVFIDDLDRLNSDEIHATLQLIRNSATFPQISFVAAYDKTYITQCIEGDGISAAYLEKIFNIEVNMPAFDKSILLQRLNEQIKVRVELKDIALFCQIEEFISRTNPEIFQLNIKTLRDVNRFVNSLKQNISSLLLTMKENDIDINNFIAIELLRINHPKIYRILRDNRTLLLDSKLGRYELEKDIDKLIHKISDALKQYLETKNPTSTPKYNEESKKEAEPINDAVDKLTKTDENDSIIAILKYLFNGNTHFAVIANYSRYFVYGISANDILYDDYLLTIKEDDCAATFKIWS